MNNNIEETLEQPTVSNDTPVLTPVVDNDAEVLSMSEPVVQETPKVEEAPATAEAIVQTMEAAASQAAQTYEQKSAPVAPQQDRVQLIDTKPKLHAVQLNGVTMSTEKNESQPVSENTEVLEVVEDTTNNVQPEQSSGKKGSTIGLFILFGGLLALIIFLPDIQAYITNQRYLKSQEVKEKITTGTLECTMEDSSETLDYDYTFNFGFSDNKLTRLKSITEIRGDVSLDEAELSKLKGECDLLESVTSGLNGVSVSCKLENGLLTKSQTFNFASIVVDDAITAYVEAGGSYPFYRNGDNVDEVERDLISSGYTCERTK
ncbi:MAG: hypothetical protein IJA30_02220 [Bacilli bacterium]|nr:hypothetical protein [Bacilli bacterium]